MRPQMAPASFEKNIQSKLANAEFRLRAAIAAEAYEEAALWRDEILRLSAVLPLR